MLPKFQTKQLTLSRLTDDVINTVLDRHDLESVTAETAREACYAWMCYSAVPSDVIAKFAEEIGRADDLETLQIVERLSAYIVCELLDEDAEEYRDQNLSPTIISEAMQQAGVKCDVNAMRTLVAYWMVGGAPGVIKNCDCLLEANGIGPESVERVVRKT